MDNTGEGIIRHNLVSYGGQNSKCQADIVSFKCASTKFNLHLCSNCRSFFSTEAFRAAGSKHGFLHTNSLTPDLVASKTRDCTLCKFLFPTFPVPKYGDKLDALHITVEFSCGDRRGTVVDFYQWLSGKASANYPLTYEPRFRLIASGGDPASAICVARPLVLDVAGQFAMSSARNWLRTCYSDHTGCQRPIASLAPVLPSRVIDTLADNYPDCRLYQAKSGERAEYACLSYCWGGSQKVTLLRASEYALYQRIKLSHIGKTIQDAIQVSREMGLRYLWIDALCIIQDDDDDKLREIGKMKSVYRDATLVIVAACASTSNSGFLHSRQDPGYDICQVQVLVGEGEEPGILSVRQEIKSHELGISHRDERREGHPLDTRAWTMQECALATRMLVYSRYEVFWHCGTESIKPVLPSHASEVPNPLDFPSVSAFRVHAILGKLIEAFRTGQEWLIPWFHLLSEYTRRDMTDPRDALHALAGIAEHVQNITGQCYLYGLWEEYIDIGLCWFSECEKLPLYEQAFTDRTRVAPSWSWAGMRNYESVTLKPTSKIVSKITILEIPFLSHFSSTPDKTSNIIASSNKCGTSVAAICPLKLCGILWPFATSSLQFEEGFSTPIWKNDEIWTHYFDFDWEKVTERGNGSGVIGAELFYLYIGTAGTRRNTYEIKLILNPDGKGMFRRVGIAQALRSDFEYGKDLPCPDLEPIPLWLY